MEVVGKGSSVLPSLRLLSLGLPNSPTVVIPSSTLANHSLGHGFVALLGIFKGITGMHTPVDLMPFLAACFATYFKKMFSGISCIAGTSNFSQSSALFTVASFTVKGKFCGFVLAKATK